MYFIPKRIRPCVKPRLLTYCTSKSAAAFEFNMEKPHFRGNLGGFGGKIPLYFCPMYFVPKSDWSSCETTSFDVLCAQIGRRVF